MSYWAVCGFDHLYGGLHGMIDYAVIEGSETDASSLGDELSQNVINSYDCILNNLNEEVESICINSGIPYGEGAEEEFSIFDEVFFKDVEYEFVELDETKLPTLDTVFLAEEYANDPEEFLDKYQK